MALWYIDVIWRTHATLDVLLGSRVDDYWKIDGDRNLSEPETGFTQFTIFNENFLTDTRGPGSGWQGPIISGQKFGQVCRKLLNIKKNSTGQLKKPNLDNAGLFEGHLIHGSRWHRGQGLHENRAQKVGGNPSCLARFKNLGHGETCGENKSNTRRSKYACIVEAHRSTRKRIGKTQQKNHEDHTLGKGFNSLSHYSLVHKFIPILQAMKIQHAKAAVDKEWEQLVKSPTWQMTKVRSKREVIPVRQKEGRNSSFSYADERMPPQQLGVTAEVHTIQRTFFRVDSVKDDSDSSAVFTEQDSDRRQDKQLMQCPPTHQTRWRTLQHCWKIPGQSVQTSGDV